MSRACWGYVCSGWNRPAVLGTGSFLFSHYGISAVLLPEGLAFSARGIAVRVGFVGHLPHHLRDRKRLVAPRQRVENAMAGAGPAKSTTGHPQRAHFVLSTAIRRTVPAWPPRRHCGSK